MLLPVPPVNLWQTSMFKLQHQQNDLHIIFKFYTQNCVLL